MVTALRETVERLQSGADYDWSHQGNCNCGHLVQTVTKLSKAEIHRMALEKAGDWGEKIIDYCRSRGTKFMVASVLNYNRRMLNFAKKLGFEREHSNEPGVVEFKLVLQESVIE